MKNLDVMLLDNVAGGAFGQLTGTSSFRPELAGLRQTFDDGSTFSVGQNGMTRATEGLGDREALLQFRQDGPMSVNSAQELATFRGVDTLVNNPGIDTVHIEARGTTFDSRLNPVESLQSGAVTRASMGQIFDDGSRLMEPTSTEPLPTPSWDGVQQQIQNERANAAFNQENFPPQSAWQGPQTETPNWSNVPFPESNGTNGNTQSFGNEGSSTAETPSFKEESQAPQQSFQDNAPKEESSSGGFDQSFDSGGSEFSEF